MCRILRQALRKRPWCRLLPSHMWLLLGAWIEKGSRFSRIGGSAKLVCQGTNAQDIFIYCLLVSYPDHLFAKMGEKAIQTSISRSRFVIVTIFHLSFSTTISEDHVAKGNITSLGKAGGISDQPFPCNPGLLGCVFLFAKDHLHMNIQYHDVSLQLVRPWECQILKVSPK